MKVFLDDGAAEVFMNPESRGEKGRVFHQKFGLWG